MDATEVINLKDRDAVEVARQQRRLVFVGRGSPWGNPYSHLPSGLAKYKVKTRDEAIKKFTIWLETQPKLVERVRRELRGKVLVCPGNCLPQACHAQVLARVADEVPEAPASGVQLANASKQRRQPALVPSTPVPATVVAAAMLGAFDPRAFGARCDECPLKGRHAPVPPAYASGGPSMTKLIIVGEGPGRMEIQSGTPFVGPSGQMINSMLSKANFMRRDAHITNAACCRGDSDNEKERAAACCAERLARELAALPTKAPVLALGAPAMKVMLGRSGILRTRGFVWKLHPIDPAKVRSAERSLEKRRALTPKIKYAASVDRAEQALWRAQARSQLAGRVCIPSIHPAFVLRGGEAHLPMLKVDVRRAVEWAAHGPLKLYDEGEFAVARTADELKRLLKTIRSKQIIIDVETLGPEPLRDKMTMLGISEVPAIASRDELVNVAARKGGAITPDDIRVVLASPSRETARDRRRMQTVLREMGVVLNEFCRGLEVGGHNFASFDMLVLKRYGIEPPRIFDSLLAHHTFASHLPQGLAHLGAMYTDCGPWKINFKTKGAEEKGGVQSKWMSGDDLDMYNAADVRINAIAWRRLQADLASEQAVYEGDLRRADVCRAMTQAGFGFDAKLAEELSAQLKSRAGALLGQMRNIVGRRDFHPARPGDLRAALFGKLKIRPIKITPTGLASTDSGALENIKNPDTRAGKLADLILRWRATHKTRSTFIESIRPHPDGRVHPSWKSFGTVTGRFSCARPNLMNLPRWSRKLEDRVRELYVAAPGHVLIYFDLSQSEMRMAAYLSGDENFIRSCESGDVHTANAKILFPDAREALERDPKGKNCPRHGDEGDARSECNCGKEYRDVAKNAGFGILYQADVETIFKFLLSKGFEDVSQRDVEAMFAQVHKVYARYYRFCDENWRYCKQHGHLREFFSQRIRWFGWYPAITDTSNYPVQGGIAGLMNERILHIYDGLPKGARIVAQVHDSGILEAKGNIAVVEKDGKKKQLPAGRAVTTTWQLIKDVWAQKIVTPTTGREWVMPIDLKLGRRWSDFG